MTDQEKIDKILLKFGEERPLSFLDNCEYIIGVPTTAMEHHLLRDTMLTRNLIDTEGHDIFFITPFGREVLKSGGWLEYLERESKDLKLKQEFEDIQFEKLKYDAKLSKWQVKTFWYIFFLSICGVISLGIQIFDKLTDTTTIDKKTLTTISIADTASTLPRTKTDYLTDTLNVQDVSYKGNLKDK